MPSQSHININSLFLIILFVCFSFGVTKAEEEVDIDDLPELNPVKVKFKINLCKLKKEDLPNLNIS